MNSDDFVSEEELVSLDFSSDDVVGRQYEKCRFKSCTFQETDLRSTVFEACSFLRCSFILPKVNGLVLRNAAFKDSRLIGIPFGECNQFGFNPEFSDCLMDSCVFVDLKMIKKNMPNNHFRNSDFMNCDFREVSFNGCRFENTQFENCDLRDADFREARDYRINPEGNRVKGSRHCLPGALSFLPFLGIELEI